MFKGLGSMLSLLGNQGKIQEEIQKFQAQVGQITAEASSGAGYVTAKVNGRMEVLSVRISDDALKLNDREMLEDLVTAAVNQALTKVRAQLAEESAKMAANIGLPPGMLGGGGFPGMG
ncbi:YbaB/EbfC family nucleoid-associated protein [Gemmata sp. G18]|uniref:Nucleoid-associated protein J8F10_13185 n=1 Tax=Gemmata palustris TaxID=2822762 RepID=A0ABS5BR71_9BACT|nr:YbaB/EbfC family nucleoid-associated protein [Gemmata palustris]MBP3956237.1 YbaB/EbfC family nucleoid-associated protein [Gemmata palustris]